MASASASSVAQTTDCSIRDVSQLISRELSRLDKRQIRFTTYPNADNELLRFHNRLTGDDVVDLRKTLKFNGSTVYLGEKDGKKIYITALRVLLNRNMIETPPVDEWTGEVHLHPSWSNYMDGATRKMGNLLGQQGWGDSVILLITHNYDKIFSYKYYTNTQLNPLGITYSVNSEDPRLYFKSNGKLYMHFVTNDYFQNDPAIKLLMNQRYITEYGLVRETEIKVESDYKIRVGAAERLCLQSYRDHLNSIPIPPNASSVTTNLVLDKNYAPFVSSIDGKDYFLYSLTPLRMYKRSEGKFGCYEIKQPNGGDNIFNQISLSYRNNYNTSVKFALTSPCILFDDTTGTYLSVGHCRINNSAIANTTHNSTLKTSWQTKIFDRYNTGNYVIHSDLYTSFFFTFTLDATHGVNIGRFSDPFLFIYPSLLDNKKKFALDFCGGLSRNWDGKFILSFGEGDVLCRDAFLEKKIIDQFLVYDSKQTQASIINTLEIKYMVCDIDSHQFDLKDAIDLTSCVKETLHFKNQVISLSNQLQRYKPSMTNNDVFYIREPASGTYLGLVKSDQQQGYKPIAVAPINLDRYINECVFTSINGNLIHLQTGNVVYRSATTGLLTITPYTAGIVNTDNLINQRQYNYNGADIYFKVDTLRDCFKDAIDNINSAENKDYTNLITSSIAQRVAVFNAAGLPPQNKNIIILMGASGTGKSTYFNNNKNTLLGVGAGKPDNTYIVIDYDETMKYHPLYIKYNRFFPNLDSGMYSLFYTTISTITERLYQYVFRSTPLDLVIFSADDVKGRIDSVDNILNETKQNINLRILYFRASGGDDETLDRRSDRLLNQKLFTSIKTYGPQNILFPVTFYTNAIAQLGALSAKYPLSAFTHQQITI